MALSAMATSKIADAVKEDIIEQIYLNEKYNQIMQDCISDAIHSIFGEMDDDLFFDLGMILMDRIELK